MLAVFRGTGLSSIRKSLHPFTRVCSQTCIRMHGKLFVPLDTSVSSLHREQFIGRNIFDSVFPFCRAVGN